MALFQLFLAELSRALLHPLPHIIIVQSQRRMDTHWKLLKDWFGISAASALMGQLLITILIHALESVAVLRNLILGPNSLQYLHHPAISCLYVRSFKSNNQIFLSVEVVTFSPDVCWVLWDLLLHCFCCLKVWSKFYDALLGFCLNKHFLEKQVLNMTSCGTFLASLWLFQILLMLWKRPC